MVTARKTLFAAAFVLTGLATISSEEMLISDLFGHLEVAKKEQGIALSAATWTSLPPQEAIAWFKGLKIVKPDVIETLESQYRNKGFSVAGVYKDYALEKTHDLLSQAIEEGTTKEAFIKQLNEAFDTWGLTRLGKYHIETVFDTNVLGSYAHGRWAQMTDPDVMRDRPFWQYQTVGDHRVRPTHAAMNGRVFPADHSVWDTWYPPNGYRCRCSVVTLSQREVEGEGLNVEKKLPQAVEVGTQVYQLIPDAGFSGSPRTWLQKA